MKKSGLFIFSMLIAVHAYAESPAGDPEPMTIPYAVENDNSGKDDFVSTDGQAEGKGDAAEKILEYDCIKAKSVCIEEDCRAKWPVFKCADFGERPAGETGDEFCAQTGKSCMAVSIGSGQTFFNECSASPASLHKTRCCWVE